MSDYFPTRDEFLASFLRQYFSLPDSMIYYITKNPSSSKVYQKLIQCCKHFFIKNPILVFHCLEIRDNNEWRICSNQTNCLSKFHQGIDIPNLSNCKLWIENKIRFYTTNPNAAVDLIPKIYQIDDTNTLNILHQKMTLNQFLFYAQQTKRCNLESVALSSDTCSEMPVEEIFAKLPNIQEFSCVHGPDTRIISSETTKKLLQIPHFGNLTHLRLMNVSPEFDIDSLYDYYKNNRSRFTFSIYYHEFLEEDLAEKLDGIVDEILDYKLYTHMPASLTYNGQSPVKKYALYQQYKNFKLR